LLKHPFLKARYADLAWEMSGPIGQRKRDPEDARIAIDSYLMRYSVWPRTTNTENHRALSPSCRGIIAAAHEWDQTT
jgi:hypothetical protein